MDTSAVASLTPDDLARLKAKCLESLYFFAKGVLGYDRLNERIHKPLCRLLEQYEQKTRLKILLPRGWYKTTIGSIAYPIWRAIRDSNSRGLIVQNTHTNAVGKLGAIDRHFRSNKLFRALFPELLPTSDCEWTREKMTVPRSGVFAEGTFEAAGIRTAVVSRHYNYVIEDDTVAPDLDDLGEENIAPSKEDVDQAIGFHRLLPPLLDQPEKDQILIIGTRWFEKDLFSWTDEREPYYEAYRRSCREDDKGQSAENGQVTFPEQFSEKVLEQLEFSMGPYMFSCLYLNKPIRSDNMLFQAEWFKYYETEPRDLIHYTTVDPAGDPEDSKGEPDWNVVATCGKSLSTGIVYALQIDRKRCNPGELLDTIFSHLHLYRPVKLGIEAVAYQKSLLYFVRERMQQEKIWTFVEPITHGHKSKNARIMGLQPAIKGGMLRFRPTMRELISEALSFPYGAHDDQLDCLSMQHGMWALTMIKSAEKLPDGIDIMTFDMAVSDLKELQRNKTSRKMGLLKDLIVKGSAKNLIRAGGYFGL